jgi:hypothetical protein
LQVKSDWQLEIKLDGSALMSSFQSIVNFDINFWSVESTTSLICLPWFSKIIKSLSESSFSFIPKLFITKSFSWSSR